MLVGGALCLGIQNKRAEHDTYELAAYRHAGGVGVKHDKVSLDRGTFHFSSSNSGSERGSPGDPQDPRVHWERYAGSWKPHHKPAGGSSEVFL